MDAASTIKMFGSRDSQFQSYQRPNRHSGAEQIAADSAPIFVNYTGPGITTEGGQGFGILALARNGGGPGINSGGITVASSGPITTSGAEALGIVADSGTIRNATQQGADWNRAGTSWSRRRARSRRKALKRMASGPPRRPAPCWSMHSIMFPPRDSSAPGSTRLAPGFHGTPGGNVAVNVAQGVSVMGGWQAGVTGVGSSTLFALPAAGVILSSTGGTATLTNDGSIGALSDRAVASSPLFPSNNTSIINNGTITGFVQLVGGNNSILNNGTFNLRHFADTNGDGVRDTLRVAIADLGAGPNNSFTNNGTLALPAVTGATTLDSTGQYLPLGNPNNAMALGGPLQGHLIGVNDVHQLGHHRSAKQPRRWRRAGDHRRAPYGPALPAPAPSSPTAAR